MADIVLNLRQVYQPAAAASLKSVSLILRLEPPGVHLTLARACSRLVGMGTHILFLCTGNICRSPLAEGILKHRLKQNGVDSVTAASAGVYGLSGRPAAEYGVEVAARHGVDISDHVARLVTREMLDEADLVVCAERKHIIEVGAVPSDPDSKYHLLSDFGPPEEHGLDIDDPYGGPINLYVIAYEPIEECVDGLLRDLWFPE